MEKYYQYAKSSELKNVYNSNNIIDFIDNYDKTQKLPIYVKEDVVVPLNKNEQENLEIVYEYPKKLTSDFIIAFLNNESIYN